MCCMRFAENTGCEKIAKNHHLRTIAQCHGVIYLQLRHLSTMGKNLLNSNISSTCPHNMVNLGTPTAEIDWWVWVTSAISMGFASWLHYCTDVVQHRSSKLCTMFSHLLGWYTIYTFLEALAPLRNSARCKIYFASKSCVLPNWQRYCTDLSIWRQLNFVARYLHTTGRPSRSTLGSRTD